MKALIFPVFLMISSSLLAQSNYSATDFKSLDQIIGLWKMDSKRGPTYEQWTRTSNEKFSGKSFRLNNQDTLIMEKIELSFSGGNIIYSPTVTGQNDGKAVDFKLISKDGNRFVFENKGHDFPNRIIYDFVSKDSISASIEGDAKGKIPGKKFSYPFVRVQ